jgi:hypothetical protein
VEVTQTQPMTTGMGDLNVRRLMLAAVLALLLLGWGPIYTYSGGVADQAKLDLLYGPPDGGYLAYGPALYLLPAGWVLAATCILLAISALPIAARRLRRVASGPVCFGAGLLMFAAVQQTDTRAWMHHYLGIGGTIGSLEVGSFSYFFQSVVVMVIGVFLMIRSLRRSRRSIAA